jgi:hypothetical protein
MELGWEQIPFSSASFAAEKGDASGIRHGEGYTWNGCEFGGDEWSLLQVMVAIEMALLQQLTSEGQVIVRQIAAGLLLHRHI